MPIRINKFLADRGIASRRGIDEYIKKKRITVNGIVLQKPGYLVRESDVITIDGKKISTKSNPFVYILLNKPEDCITTAHDTHDRETVFDYIDVDVRVFPIGRLDKNTTGVLIFTNDGELANRLMHPRYAVEKVYRAYLGKPLTDKDKHILEAGVTLDHKRTAPCKISFIGDDKQDVSVAIHEGRNRQIHRMFNLLGYSVQKLDRTHYAGLTAKGLKKGNWRYLTKKEVDSLKYNR
ncbi:rRNA pseudouridine synthase [Candidatus Uhrbacteria bacterium]|nr:rRNA pseudouridine synthase [Candidatus Uhrbacteria bacterium]